MERGERKLRDGEEIKGEVVKESGSLGLRGGMRVVEENS